MIRMLICIRTALLLSVLMFIPVVHAATNYDDYEKIVSNPPLAFLTCSADNDCEALNGPCIGWRAINTSHAEEWTHDANLGAADKKCLAEGDANTPQAGCTNGKCVLKSPCYDPGCILR
jgi:hypothetical protein